jgi:hypothetical protein
LLKTISLQKKELNYHDKITNKINSTFNFFPSEFWESKPIISGSYAINLLFKPAAEYSDVDFYFETLEDLQNARAVINTIDGCIEKEFFNCINYEFNNMKFQLIKKYLLPAKKLIYTHDFKNSSIAIQGEVITIDDELFGLYNSSTLSIRTTQITNEMSEKDTLLKIGNLLNRIAKYIHRYELALDEPSLDLLSNLKRYLSKVPIKTKQKVVINTSIYYNNTFNPLQNNLRSMHEVEQYLDALISQPDIAEDELVLEF